MSDLPVILMELDSQDYMAIKKTYIYANSQILCQHDGNDTDPRYFYMHDRLGNVRQVFSSSGDVKNYYTYEPFGEVFDTENAENISNPFKFTGQYFDSETGEYYLRARQYNPHIYRFTSRDPVAGKFEEPLTLHVYLYCINNPINRIDPQGLSSLLAWLLRGRAGTVHADTEETLRILHEATDLVGRWWSLGPARAFMIPGVYDYKHTGSTFQLDNAFMQDSEFGNYLAGYSTYYNYVEFGDVGVRRGGDLYALADYLVGQSDIPYDDPGSNYFISAGLLHSREARAQEGKRRGIQLSFVLAKFDLYEGIRRMAETDLTSTEFDRELNTFTQFWNSCTK